MSVVFTNSYTVMEIEKNLGTKEDAKVPPKKRSPLKKNKRGQLVDSNQKLMIINLHKKMKEDNPNITSKSAVAQLIKLTNIGTSTIRKILQEYKNTGTITSPNRKKCCLCFKEKIDKFVKNAIQQKIREFYINKELPTLIQVLKAVNAFDKNLPTYKRSTFHLLLKQLNFTFINRHHSILIERDDIIIWRRNYLRNIKRYREESRQIYYLDETWVSATDVIEFG